MDGRPLDRRPLLFNLIEGGIRLSIFVGYLLLIGLFKDIRRVFQYHGAEHKTIYAYENGDDSFPRRSTTITPRCTCAAERTSCSSSCS